MRKTPLFLILFILLFLNISNSQAGHGNSKPISEEDETFKNKKKSSAQNKREDEEKLRSAKFDKTWKNFSKSSLVGSDYYQPHKLDRFTREQLSRIVAEHHPNDGILHWGIPGFYRRYDLRDFGSSYSQHSNVKDPEECFSCFIAMKMLEAMDKVRNDLGQPLIQHQPTRTYNLDGRELDIDHLSPRNFRAVMDDVNSNIRQRQAGEEARLQEIERRLEENRRNTSQQQKDQEESTREKDLEQRVKLLERENEELRKKMLSPSIHASSSSTLPPKIIPEDQVAGYCVSALLKRDPQIFFPWILTQKITEVIATEISSNQSFLPSHIVVEGGKPLLFYVKEELNKGLDAEIVKEGKNSFKKLVSSIAALQGSFWTGSEGKGISTVPLLLKKLDEGNAGQEWVPGWNDLEGEYKRYIAATVLYKLSNNDLPKEYGDIDPYLR